MERSDSFSTTDRIRQRFPSSDGIPLGLETVSVFALIFAVFRVFVPFARSGIDNTVIMLLVIAALPWISVVWRKVQVSTSGFTLEAAQMRVEQLETRTDEQRKRVDAQQQLINSLVTSGMGEWVYIHLREVAKRQLRGDEYNYKADDSNMRRDLRFLIDHGYVEPFDLEKSADLVKEIEIKDIGLIYVLFRGDPAQVPPGIDPQYLSSFNR